MVNVLIGSSMHKLHNFNKIVGRDPKDLNTEELISYNYYIESGRIAPVVAFDGSKDSEETSLTVVVADTTELDIFCNNEAAEEFKKQRLLARSLSQEIRLIEKEYAEIELKRERILLRLKNTTNDLYKNLKINEFDDLYSQAHEVFNSYQISRY